MNMSQSDQEPNVANKSLISHETKKTKSKTVTKKTNLKKRNYNEYDTNTNNNSEPNSKRRKVNKNNIHDKLNTLINTNKSYKKQIDYLTKEKEHYKHGFNIYKQEANKWKTQYMTLYSQICNVTNTKTNLQINTIKANKDIVMNNNELSSLPTPPPSKNIHKRKHKTNHDIMQTDNIESILTESENMLATNENQSVVSNNAKLNNNINIETHLMAKNRNKSAVNSNVKFNHDDNYRQLRSHTKRTKKRRKKKHYSSESSDYVAESNDDNDSIAYKSFEENYYVSVRCHICKKHFDDFDEYKEHIKNHYDLDATKTWKQC
eukprot:401032_1